MAEFRVIDLHDERTEVALAGRLDLQGVNEVTGRFETTVGARRKPAVVDLSGVEFIASLGIGMLTGAAKSLRAHGHAMVMIVPEGLVEQTLRAASIDAVIPIAADREAALALL